VPDEVLNAVLRSPGQLPLLDQRLYEGLVAGPYPVVKRLTDLVVACEVLLELALLRSLDECGFLRHPSVEHGEDCRGWDLHLHRQRCDAVTGCDWVRLSAESASDSASWVPSATRASWPAKTLEEESEKVCGPASMPLEAESRRTRRWGARGAGSWVVGALAVELLRVSTADASSSGSLDMMSAPGE
jgi:hypothetical protein